MTARDSDGHEAEDERLLAATQKLGEALVEIGQLGYESDAAWAFHDQLRGEAGDPDYAEYR